MKFEEHYIENSSKHRDYFEIYDSIFANVDRFGEYNILEIGVDIGSGVRALSSYFPNSKITGLDINPECTKHKTDKIEIIIGSQVDSSVLEELANRKFDLIIDDGSHMNNHVSNTFFSLFQSLSSQKIGIYIIEDVHTSYWSYYGGGYQRKDSTVENFKNLIDHMHLWCIRDPVICHTPPYPGALIDNTYFEKWIKFIQFYENIIVVKKRDTPARCSKPI